MNKNDLRYIKTEETIIDAFSKCVYELGFERTTIAAICQKARISRNTFYFHYEDKYDLLNTLYANLETKLGNSLEEHTIEELKHYSIRDSVEWTYSEIKKNKEDILLLLTCSRDKMRNLFRKAFIDDLLVILVPNYKKKSENIKLQLVKNYTADAMVGYIETWLNHYDEISVNDIIDIMEKLCTVPVQTHFEMLGMLKEN